MEITLDNRKDEKAFIPIFDGVTLAGWHVAPRTCGSVYPGGPSVLKHFDSLGLPRPVEREKHPAQWRGPIALEVHDNDAMFGEARWGKGAQRRWRNIRIKELPTGSGEVQQ